MARMFPATCPAHKGDAPVAAAERLLFERLGRELDLAWSVIHDCEIRANAEIGTVEFVLVHRTFGLALLGVAEPDEEADPGLAVAAMRGMLDQIGFSRRFPGSLAVVAMTLRPREEADLRTLIEGAFAAAPAGAVADPTWADWLVQRLMPQRQPGAEAAGAPDDRRPAQRTTPEKGLRLRAPDPEEAWRVAEAARGRANGQGAPAMHVTPEPILASEAAAGRPTSWVGMALAILVVSIVLLGMALLSHGNGAPPRAVIPPISGD